MNRWLGLLLLAVVTGSIGCNISSKSDSADSSRLTAENYRKIQTGMSRQDVIDILGFPSQDHMGSRAVNALDEARFLAWSDGVIDVRVTFNAEGHVIAKEQKAVVQRTSQ